MPAAAIIGGFFSLGQGLFGASEASKQNKRAEKAYKQQVKQQKQIARATNKYNRQVFRIDKQNYQAQYDYQWQSALQSWERGKEIQDYQYAQDMRAYERSVGIRDQQIQFNDLAAKQAYAAEDASLAGLFRQQAFDRESIQMGLQQTLLEGKLNRRATQSEIESVVLKGQLAGIGIQKELKELTKQSNFKQETALAENLQKQGEAELRQASRAKGQQVTMGEFYRGMSQLSSALMGSQRQAAMKLMEVGIDTSLTKAKLGFELERADMAMANATADAAFNLRVLDADAAAAAEQSAINKQQIALEQYGANLQAAAATMIRPERLSYEPEPLKPPERIFIRPMKVQPGGVAEPVKQNVWGPIMQGFGNAAGALAKVDWTKGMTGNNLSLMEIDQAFQPGSFTNLVNAVGRS